MGHDLRLQGTSIHRTVPCLQTPETGLLSGQAIAGAGFGCFMRGETSEGARGGLRGRPRPASPSVSGSPLDPSWGSAKVRLKKGSDAPEGEVEPLVSPITEVGPEPASSSPPSDAPERRGRPSPEEVVSPFTGGRPVCRCGQDNVGCRFMRLTTNYMVSVVSRRRLWRGSHRPSLTSLAQSEQIP